MRIKRVAHGSTQLDANPWNRMWIVKVDTKHKDAWQANHRHKSRRGCDSHSGDRPEIGYNFGDPTLVETPGYLFRPALSLHPLQQWAKGVHQIEQFCSLMADLMHKRGGDTVSNHALAWNANDCDWVFVTSRQAGPGTTNGGAVSSIQVADDRRGVVVTR